MSMDDEKRVREFCAAWSRRSIDELLDFFTDDAVYHNIPMDAVQGKAAIRDVLNTFVPPAEKIEFEMRNVASTDGVVFTERVDRFVVGGKRIDLPVAGVFELRGGQIAAWRDYFDMQSYLKQAGG